MREPKHTNNIRGSGSSICGTTPAHKMRTASKKKNNKMTRYPSSASWRVGRRNCVRIEEEDMDDMEEGAAEEDKAKSSLPLSSCTLLRSSSLLMFCSPICTGAAMDRNGADTVTRNTWNQTLVSKMQNGKQQTHIIVLHDIPIFRRHFSARCFQHHREGIEERQLPVDMTEKSNFKGR